MFSIYMWNLAIPATLETCKTGWISENLTNPLACKTGWLRTCKTGCFSEVAAFQRFGLARFHCTYMYIVHVCIEAQGSMPAKLYVCVCVFSADESYIHVHV